MKQFFKRVALLLGLFALTTACTQSEGLDTVQNGVTFTSTIGTRVTGNTFDAGDDIFVQAYEGDVASQSATYTYGNSIFSSSEPFNPTASQSLSYVAIYPNAEYDFSSGSFTFSSQVDQDTYEAYEQSSLLIAEVEATTSEQPALQFGRKMANVVYKIEGVESSTIKSMTLSLKNSVEIDLAGGTIEATGDVADITAYKDGDYFGFIVAPQDIAKGVTVLTINYAGYNYEWLYSADHTLQSGYRYDYTVTLDEAGEIYSVDFTGQIEEWSPSQLAGGAATSENDPYGFGDALTYTLPSKYSSTLSAFSPSSIASGNMYYPIQGKGSSSTSSNANTSASYTSYNNTRILPYIDGFTPDYSPTSYKARVNRYGSNLNAPQEQATGRFYTKKIGNRWWIIDPDGYRHIQRALNTIDPKNGADGAWAAKWTSNLEWLKSVGDDFKEIGMNGAGGFGDSQSAILGYSNAYPEQALTLTPSFGFIAAYNKAYSVGYPDGSSITEMAIPYYVHSDGTTWESWCETYVKTQLAGYEADPNTLGFFSDNELQFSSNSKNLIEELLAIGDESNYGYAAAMEFINRKGYNASSLSQTQMDEFAGEAAAKYYGGVRAALTANNYEILYLGSRLHGMPKRVESVIQAAANNCDIISINYYNRWSVEHTGTTEGSGAIVTNYWEAVDKPFMITEFYAKGADVNTWDTDILNNDGEGWLVKTQADRGYWYQHFTLGLLESQSCVGWHWFRYQDDWDGDEGANRGFYDRQFNLWETLSHWAKGVNYNVYELTEFFDIARDGAAQ